MNPDFHNMQNLFHQLGLPDDEEAIETFIENHKLKDGEKIESAAFWSDSQAAFIQECLSADSDWAEVVDQLNVQLRQ